MRVSFVVDGFNLYHSIRDAERDNPARPQRWLDLRSFCSEFLPSFGPSAKLEKIFYFSAIAKHLEPTKPDIEARHRIYLDALRFIGVDTTLAKFMARDKYIHFKYCRFKIPRIKKLIRLPLPLCKVVISRAEEKETDVAIASKLFELLHTGSAEAVVLVSGDTDLLPAIRTCRSLFPTYQIAVAFPYKRHNASLRQAVTKHFKITKDQYARHQLPDPITLPGGREIKKPARW